jgi:uncharacterized protein Yka (UPF0111/DUF47 family)
VRFRLVPTDDRFFTMFSDAARNVAACARVLQSLIDNPATAPKAHTGIVAHEQDGDALTRQILHRLNSTSTCFALSAMHPERFTPRCSCSRTSGASKGVKAIL